MQAIGGGPVADGEIDGWGAVVRQCSHGRMPPFAVSKPKRCGLRLKSGGRSLSYGALQKKGRLPKRPTGADCKSASYAFRGSNPRPTTIFQMRDLRQIRKSLFLLPNFTKNATFYNQIKPKVHHKYIIDFQGDSSVRKNRETRIGTAKGGGRPRKYHDTPVIARRRPLLALGNGLEDMDARR